MQTTQNSKNVCNHIKKRKLDLISVLGGQCCLCGFNKFPEALEFHHVNPNEKSFGIASGKNVTLSLEKQLIELRKCVLVCANCHRGIHGGYLISPSNPSDFFNEDIANMLIQENQELRFGKKQYCERCGAIISNGATYCKKCYDLLQRKVERPNREVLKNLIRIKPFTHIAQDFNVTDNTIRKWCKYYQLPYKKTDIKKYSELEWQKI